MNDPLRSAHRLIPISTVSFEQERRAVCRVLLLALLAFATANAFPQTRRDLKIKSAAVPIIPAQNLDFSGGRLPEHFAPIDPSELYEAARRVLATPEKSEFETTAQYQSRIGVLAQKELFRGVKANDDFAFVLRPSSRSIAGLLRKQDDFLTTGFVETKYDADSQLMYVFIPTDGGDLSSNYEWVTSIHRSVTYGAPYVGKNAFGSRSIVRVVRTDTLELEVGDYGWLAHDSVDSDFDNTFPDIGTGKIFFVTVEPGAARDLSENIEIIMIGKLHAPFVSHSIDGTEASLEQVEPTDITLVHKLLHLTLDRIVIANSRTGEIFKDLSRQNTMQNSR